MVWGFSPALATNTGMAVSGLCAPFRRRGRQNNQNRRWRLMLFVRIIREVKKSPCHTGWNMLHFVHKGFRRIQVNEAAMRV